MKHDKNTIELLAPAGNYEAFIAAINAGANAVYMGVDRYNARNMARNFSIEEYIEAIYYAHKRDVKVYLTLNTLLLDSEIKEAVNIVIKLYEQGLDAVIVQDIGFANILHKILPDLNLHASTQMSVCTIDQVKFLENIGFTRVVLGRELSIDEISNISKNTNIEIEVFVHGALCVCVSGQCMMSSMIGERSANRGSCAQPCRKTYSLYKEGTNSPLVREKYLLSKKDIYGIKCLKELKTAGVDSFKIEGRNKVPEYVAGAVSIYRNVIDNDFNISKEEEKNLLQLFNRSGKSEGYFRKVGSMETISLNTPKNTGLILGKVLDYRKPFVKIELEENINLHDGIEIITKEGKVSQIVTCIKDDKENTLNTLSKKGNIVWLGDIKQNIEKGNVIYKTSDNELNEHFKRYYTTKEHNKRKEYNIEANIIENENIYAIVKNKKVQIDYFPEQSKNAPLTIEKVKENFLKTEDTSVKFVEIKVNISDNIFVPASKLNELRRAIVDKLEKDTVIKRNINEANDKANKLFDYIKNNNKTNNKIENGLYTYKYSMNVNYIDMYKTRFNKKLDKIYISAKDFKMYEKDIFKYLEKIDIYFVIPNVTLKNIDKYIKENVEKLVDKGLAGIVIGNIGYIPYCKKLKEKYNIKLIGDYTLNIMNCFSASFMKENMIDVVTPIFENEDVDVDKIANITNVELVEGLATAMTTRYCVIRSCINIKNENKSCEGACMKDEYIIVDSMNKKYNIITDPNDCIISIVRNKRKYEEKVLDKHSIRYNILK